MRFAYPIELEELPVDEGGGLLVRFPDWNDAVTDGADLAEALENARDCLEEMIAALEQELKDLEKKRTPKGQQPGAGQPAEPRLVHEFAELKLILSLQKRINKRTQRFGEMIKGEQAETPELLEALRELAERQQRVFRATADLSQGRND